VTGACEAGPNVVAGMAELESGIRIRSHVVKVAGRSMDVNYPIRTAYGGGGAYGCATTTRNPEASGFISFVQNNSKGHGGVQNFCVSEKTRVLRHSCSSASNVGVKTVQGGKSDVDEYEHVKLVIKKLLDSLTPDQREEVVELIKKNSDLFSKHDFDVGCTDFVTASINTGNHPLISELLHRHARVHLDVIDEMIDKMIEADIVEPCILEWAANLVVVAKKDDQGRAATPCITSIFGS